MKLLENSKFTGPALILLLCLNTTLMVMLLFKHPPKPPGFPPPPPMEQGGGPRNFLVHELDMSADQQAKYDALIKIHHASIDELQKDIRKNRDQLVHLLSGGIDSAQISDLSANIGADQAKIERTTFYHFRDVRGICTPEQQVRFDSVIHEALRMMAPGRPPGNPPPPGN